MHCITTLFVHRREPFVHRCWPLVGMLLATLLFSTAARSEDSATRGTVRGLATEGMTAYEAGDYVVALEKFEAVYGTVKIPTFALLLARALEKNGRLVEASERYLEATRLPNGEGAPAAQEQARVLAAEEREKLLPRVPQLVIRVSPKETEGLAVFVGGVPYNVALLGAKRPTDPGSVKVSATRGDLEREVTVELVEGKTKEVLLDLNEEAGTAEVTSAPLDSEEGNSARPFFVYGGFSLGVAGLGTGVATGIMALSKADKLKSDYACDEDGLCDEGGEDEKKKVATLGTVSTIGFGVGAVGVALGIYGLFLEKPREGSPATAARSGFNLEFGQTNRVTYRGSF